MTTYVLSALAALLLGSPAAPDAPDAPVSAPDGEVAAPVPAVPTSTVPTSTVPTSTAPTSIAPISTVPGAPPPAPSRVSARSRIFMRLDPALRPTPDGEPVASTLGSFRVRSWGEVNAEASGWIAHRPGSVSRDEDVVSGDVTTLLYRGQTSGVRWVAGRQWTAIGGQRLDALDGLTARAAVGKRVQLAARVGQSGLEPREAFGDTQEVGAEARISPADGAWLGLGMRHQRVQDTAPRTRWTTTADYGDGPWRAAGASTVDVDAEAVVDARVELAGAPTESLWLRGYGRHVRVDLLLAPDELLALFVEDVRDEAGAVVEYELVEAWRVRLDGGWVHSADRAGASRWRGGIDFRPRRGATLSAEGTVRIDRLGRSSTGRLAGRWPVRPQTYITGEAVGDFAAAPGEVLETAGLVRVGLGFEPWPGWMAYGAVEAARTPRWPHRVAGMMLFEYAMGAPVRWGGSP